MSAYGTLIPSCLLAAISFALVGCDRSVAASDRETSPASEATVLLDSGYAGSWPTGLDPATNMTARANLSIMNAIYGGLFQLVEQPGAGFEVVGVLAESYEFEDEGHTLVIRLRDGVTFSDGTPFDAEAVRFNIERNLDSPCTCAPTTWPWLQKGPRVTVEGSRSVRLHFRQPYVAAINSFPVANINWIASPTAMEKMGVEAFRNMPVGAGPFRVVRNELSSRLVLERNALYWQEGRPFLNRLVFQSIGSEQAALQALIAGDAQAVEGITSTPLIEQAQASGDIVVVQQLPTSPYVIQLNTRREPFSDLRIREAIYYATAVDAIRKGLFKDWYPTSQSFTATGGLFHHPRIAGYREYDADKARAILSTVGPVKVHLGTIRSFVAEQVITALQAQWQAVGFEVEVEVFDLGAMIQHYKSGEWEAMLQTVGSYDPGSSIGPSFRFRSDQPYTGVHDEELDRLLDDAAATFDPAEREALYLRAGEHISRNAYAPFLFAFAPAQLTTRGLTGPGLSTKLPPIAVNTGVHWQDVAYR